MRKTTLILSSVVAILFVAVLYLLYLNLQKPAQIIITNPTPYITPSPTLPVSPTSTVDQTTDWKSYENKKYGYQFKCPENSVHTVEVTNGNGLTIPYYQERCTSGIKSFRVSVYSLSHQQIIDSVTNNGYLNILKNYQLKVEGYDKNYYSSILSTFKIIKTNENISGWKQGGIPIVRGDLEDYITTDGCVALIVYKPQKIVGDLKEHINRVYNLSSEPSLYKIQFTNKNNQAITIPAMNAEEISNTFVQVGQSVYQISSMVIVPQGPPTCKSNYDEDLSSLISTLSLN